MMCKITVIIPNYKGIDYLNNCLLSLYDQGDDTPKFRILIVDNASADGSVELAQELAEQMQGKAQCVEDVRFICLTENTGFCHAVNVGIREADTPYVLLLNNDTKAQPGFVKHLYETISKKKNLFSVSAQMLMWDRPDLLDDAGDQYNVLGWAYGRGKGKKASDFNRPAYVFSACGGAAIYRKEVFDKIGLFDELHFAYLEDLDVGYRAQIYGYRNAYEPRAKVLHFGSASSGSRYNEFKTKLSSANNIYVIYKNMPLLQIIWNFPFLLVGFFVKWLFFCKKKMGRIYFNGLLEGMKRCGTLEGKRCKVCFTSAHLGNYLKIQMKLYKNSIFYLQKK